MNFRKFTAYFAGLILVPSLIGVSMALYVMGEVQFANSSRTSVEESASPRVGNQLRGLGYSGAPVPSETGVTTFNFEKAQRNLSCYCGRQGYGAYLIDMEGTGLHWWHYPFEGAFGYLVARNPKKLRELGKKIASPY